MEDEERSLGEDEELYRLLVEGARDYAIFMLDPEGRVKSWNEGARRIKGYRRDEILGRHFSVFYPEEDVERGRPEEVLRLAADEGRYEEEGRRVRKDGSGFWASVVITALTDESGRLRGFAKVVRDVTERKEAEEALRASEEEYRAVFELAGVGKAQGDPATGRLLRVNPKLCEITGYSEEDLLGTPFSEITHPDDREVNLEGWRRLVRGEVAEYEGDKRFVRKDGSVVWASVNATVVRDASGRALRAVATIQDVTERRRAEEALKGSEERFRATFEQAAVGVAHVGPDGRWLRVNDSLCRIVGYDREDLLGMTFQDVSHPEDLDKDLEQVRRLLAGEVETYALEKRYLRKDGSVVWIDLTVSLVRDGSGEPEYFISVVEDIAERKRIEGELRESEERLRLLIRNSSDVISIFGAEGTVVYQSPSIERVLGHRPEDRIGKNVFEDPLVHPDDLSYLRAFFAEARANPGADATGEFRLRHADGSWRHIEAVGRNLLDEPSVAGIVANYRDVTGRRRAEEELGRIREAERRRISRDLHDGVLQDLAGALQALQLTRLRAQRSGLDLDLSEEISALRRSAEGLRGAVHDLRLQGEQPFVRAVEDLVKSERRLDPEREVDLSAREGFPEELPERLGSELLRVLGEALTNARKHSGARCVEVVLGTERGRVRLEVADDGRGFVPDETPGTSGGGVGLSTMRERVEALGGTLEVRSRPGEGTRVTAVVPFS